MSVKSRIVVLVCVALAGTVCLWVLLVRDISAVYGAANFANINTVPAVRILAQVDHGIDELRIATWQHVTSSDPEAVERLEGQIVAARSEVRRSLYTYEATIVDDADRAALRADREAFAEYLASQDRVLELSRAGKKDEARALLLTSRQVVSRLQELVAAHYSYNTTLAESSSKRSAATRRFSLTSSCVMVSTLLAILVFMGFSTVDWIMAMLGGEPGDVVRIARGVAAGNLSCPVALRRNDSSSLLAVLVQMQHDGKVRLREERIAAAERDGMLAAIDRSMGLIEFDMRGRVITANAHFLRIVGYTLDEIKGRHHRMFVSLSEANSPAYGEFMEGLLAGKYAAGQRRRLGKDGRVIWLQATYNPILDGAGKPFKIVKLATDISDRVRTAEEVRNLAQADSIGGADANAVGRPSQVNPVMVERRKPNRPWRNRGSSGKLGDRAIGD